MNCSGGGDGITSGGGTLYSQDDLDTFLSSIESKLRSPFSSLDLVKAASSDRSSSSRAEYLHKLLQVITKPDKIIQCRMLIGLLGIDDDDDDDDTSSTETAVAIARILKETQLGSEGDGGEGKEWVRIISGLVQGILFRPRPDDDDDEDKNDKNNTRESCRGAEAARMVSKLCDNVCQKVNSKLKHEREHHHTNNDDDDSPSTMPDMNACFAPYRYSLISTPILNTIIPEFAMKTMVTELKDGRGDDNDDDLFANNCHFQVNATADILHLDEQLERQRAKEQQEHGALAATSAGSGLSGAAALSLKSSSAAAAAATAKEAMPANFRPANLTSKKGGTAGRSSLFVPNAKGRASSAATAKSNLFNTSTKHRPVASAAAAGGAGGGAKTAPATLVNKALLRRKGGATQLVNRTTMKAKMEAMSKAKAASSSASAAAAKASSSGMTGISRLGGAGRTVGKFGGAVSGRASKMKMIDVAEVDNLTKEHAKRDNDINSRVARKRKIMEAAQKQGIKKAKAAPAAPPAETTEGAAGVPNDAPVTAVPPEMQQLQPSTEAAALAGATAAPLIAATDDSVVSELASLLHVKNNKLGDEDRIRLQQFMQRLPNPTPDQGSLCRIKIHEERGQDPETGRDIKETYYLELDYDTHTFSQAKKVKRY